MLLCLQLLLSQSNSSIPLSHSLQSFCSFLIDTQTIRDLSLHSIPFTIYKKKNYELSYTVSLSYLGKLYIIRLHFIILLQTYFIAISQTSISPVFSSPVQTFDIIISHQAYYKLLQATYLESSNLPINSHKMQRGLHQKIIKNSQFQNRVKQWIRHHDPLSKDPFYQYKFSLSKILPLADNLLLNAILYASYATFPFLLEDLTPQIKINTSLHLKQIYTSEFYSGKWKQDFYFQFTMIYLIKTVSKFIEEHFPKLDINENLESQMYLILNNVFIGTEVGTKLYHVTAKKYIKYLNLKVSKKNKSLSKQKKVSILTTFPCKPSSKQINDTLHSQVSNGTKQKILNVNFNINNLNLGRFGNYLSIRRHPRRHKLSFLRQRVEVPKEKSFFEIFVGELKKSLHVDPLPVIKGRKVDIGEYVGMRCVGKELNQCEDGKYIDLSFSKSLYLAKGKISSSMQTILQVNHPGILTRSMSKDMRPCNKVALSQQLNSKHYSLKQAGNKTKVNNDKSLVEIKCNKSDKQLNGVKNSSGMMPKVNGKLTLEDWSQLLRKIKLNSKNSNSSEKENYLKGKTRTRKSLPKHSIHAYSLDNSSNNKKIPTKTQQNFSFSNQTTLKAQTLNQVLPNTQNDSNDQTEQLNDQNFIKLDFSTISMEPGDKDCNKHRDNFQIRQHVTLLEKKYKKKSPFQQLSKTSKLKLSKMTFLSQCHQRQMKLKEKQNQNDLRRDSWIYKALQ